MKRQFPHGRLGRTSRLILVSILVLFWVGCFDNTGHAGGSSSDGEAKVAGLAIYEDGTPAIGARLRVRSQAYLLDPAKAGLAKTKDTAFDTATGRDGTFDISGLAPGSYSLEVNDGNGKAAHLDVTMANGGSEPPADRSIAVLRMTGAVKGTMTGAGGPGGAIIQVYGLDRAAKTDSTGEFLLADMPVGEFRIICRNPGPAGIPLEVAGVKVVAKDTVNLGALERSEDLATWRHMRTLHIRTSTLALTKTQDRMPLLVRLDSANFDFSQARRNGEDIRFSRPNGQLMRFGIKAWDSASARAEIWVRIDTLLPGPQSFRMHWGRESVASRSDGFGVFTTSIAFHGAFHFNRGRQVGLDSIIPDATGNRNIGRSHGPPNWVDSGGVSSFGSLHLDDANAWMNTTKPYTNLQAFTLSFWFRTRTAVGGRLGGMGSSRYGESRFQDREVWMDDSGKVYFGMDSSLGDSPSPGLPSILGSDKGLNDGEWHHVAALLSPSEGQALYVDGIKVASNPQARKAGNYTGYWRIGYDLSSMVPAQASRNWTGQLQEFWMVHAARDSEWIRILYESMRPGSNLIGDSAE